MLSLPDPFMQPYTNTEGGGGGELAEAAEEHRARKEDLDFFRPRLAHAEKAGISDPLGGSSMIHSQSPANRLPIACQSPIRPRLAHAEKAGMSDPLGTLALFEEWQAIDRRLIGD